MIRPITIAGLLLTTVLAIPAARAEQADRTALLREAQAFGTLVGQAAHCKIDAAIIHDYIASAVPRRLPKTGDAAFDEQMNQAFEQAMRSATQPPSGCDQVKAVVTRGQ